MTNTLALKLPFGWHVLEDGLEVKVSGVGTIMWRSDCEICVRNGKDSFAPSHDASRRCRSGSYSHCTCDTCF